MSDRTAARLLWTSCLRAISALSAPATPSSPRSPEAPRRLSRPQGLPAQAKLLDIPALRTRDVRNRKAYNLTVTRIESPRSAKVRFEGYAGFFPLCSRSFPPSACFVTTKPRYPYCLRGVLSLESRRQSESPGSVIDLPGSVSASRRRERSRIGTRVMES